MKKGTIYFIECPALNAVKIGYTTNIKARLSAIQTGNPLPVRVLATFPGTRRQERLIQKALKEFQLMREWFILNDTVKEIIKAAEEKAAE